jgi:hypothetical protein
MRINRENAKIKEKNSQIIEKLLSLQNRLMSLNIIGLSNNEKSKIDLLYSYIKDRNIALVKIVDKDGSIDL